MVNLEEMSVAEFRSLFGESVVAAAFCHSVGARAESLQLRVDSSSSEDKDEASQAPIPAVTMSVSEVHSVFLLNSGCASSFMLYSSCKYDAEF